MKKNVLVNNYFYNLLYRLLVVFAPLFTTPYVSRILAADGIGEYSYVNSYATYFSMFGILGITIYGQMEIAKCRNDDKKRNIVFWEIFIAKTITMLIAIVIYAFIVFCANVPYKKMFLVLMVYLISQLIDVTWFLQGLEEFKSIAIKNMIVKILSIVLIFLLVKKKTDLYLYVFILQGSVLVGNLSLWKYIIDNVKFVNWKDVCFWKHWKGSFSLFIPTIATSVYTVLDKSMLGMLTKSVYQSGYYEQAHKIEQLLSTIVTSISTVILPRMTYLYNSGNDKEAKIIQRISFQFTAMISIPMSLGVIGIASNLVPVFLGEGYKESIPILCVFSILIIILGFDNLIGKQYLMAKGRQKEFNIGVIIGAIVNLGLNMLLIPCLGGLGAAIASVIAEASILMIFIWYSKVDIEYRCLLKNTMRYFLMSFIMLIGVFCIDYLIEEVAIALIIQVICGIMIYGILLLVTHDSLLSKILKIK